MGTSIWAFTLWSIVGFFFFFFVSINIYEFSRIVTHNPSIMTKKSKLQKKKMNFDDTTKKSLKKKKKKAEDMIWDVFGVRQLTRSARHTSCLPRNWSWPKTWRKAWRRRSRLSNQASSSWARFASLCAGPIFRQRQNGTCWHESSTRLLTALTVQACCLEWWWCW